MGECKKVARFSVNRKKGTGKKSLTVKHPRLRVSGKVEKISKNGDNT